MENNEISLSYIEKRIKQLNNNTGAEPTIVELKQLVNRVLEDAILYHDLYQTLPSEMKRTLTPAELTKLAGEQPLIESYDLAGLSNYMAWVGMDRLRAAERNPANVRFINDQAIEGFKSLHTQLYIIHSSVVKIYQEKLLEVEQLKIEIENLRSQLN